MGRRIEHTLLDWLGRGGLRMGEIAIGRGEGGFTLRHVSDAGNSGLGQMTSPEDALEIARWDAAGKYRPLKTAPTLRAGWELRLTRPGDLVLALEYFYPAMLASYQAARELRLGTTPLRETLERQTGMYAITKKASREDAEEVVRQRCNSESGCLKTILWTIDGEQPRGLPPEKFQLSNGADGLPLPCAEGCNLLVAAIRRQLKKRA